MHRRHQRRLHMGDQADAAGPELAVGPPAPGICLRNSSLKAPWTVETLTPTFSKTRPRMTDMTPPPPCLPSSVGPLPGRALEAPGGPIAERAGQLVLQRSKAAQIRSRSSLEPGDGLAALGVGRLDLAHRSEIPSSAAALRPITMARRQRDIERAQSRPHRDRQACIGGLMDRRGTPRALAAEQERCRRPRRRNRYRPSRPWWSGAAGGRRRLAARSRKGVPGCDGADLGARRDSPCRPGAGGCRPKTKPQGSMISTGNAEAGGEPQHRAAVLRDIGLEQGEARGVRARRKFRCGRWPVWQT